MNFFNIGLAMYLESRFRQEFKAHGVRKGDRGFWFCNHSFKSNPEQKFRKLVAKPARTTTRKVLELNELRARMQIAKLEAKTRTDGQTIARKMRNVERQMQKLIQAA